MKGIAAIAACVILAGCAAQKVEAQMPGANAATYVCRNGETVSAQYSGAGQPARITIGGATIQVQPEPAPFGAKFKAPDDTLFWVNGQDVLMEWSNGAMLFCRQH